MQGLQSLDNQLQNSLYSLVKCASLEQQNWTHTHNTETQNFLSLNNVMKKKNDGLQKGLPPAFQRS